MSRQMTMMVAQDSMARVVPLSDRPAPPPLGPTSSARKSPKRSRLLAAFKWFSFRTSPERRRAILFRGFRAGAVACIIGLGVVTAGELLLGSNLSCYIWDVGCSLIGNPPSILYLLSR